MANTYSQIYIQVVFAVQGRQNLLRKEHKEELHKYVTGIITHQKQKLLAIHCMPEHAHILIGLRPSMALADLVEEVTRIWGLDNIPPAPMSRSSAIAKPVLNPLQKRMLGARRALAVA